MLLCGGWVLTIRYEREMPPNASLSTMSRGPVSYRRATPSHRSRSAAAVLLTGMVATDALAAGHGGYGGGHMGGRFGEPLIGSDDITDLQSVHSVQRDSVARGPGLAGKPWITVSLKSEHCDAAAGGNSGLPHDASKIWRVQSERKAACAIQDNMPAS
jgi:hypothetical protein